MRKSSEKQAGGYGATAVAKLLDMTDIAQITYFAQTWHKC